MTILKAISLPEKSKKNKKFFIALIYNEFTAIKIPFKR